MTLARLQWLACRPFCHVAAKTRGEAPIDGRPVRMQRILNKLMAEDR